MEEGVSGAETAFFDGSLCREPASLSDGDQDNSAETFLEESLHCLRAEEEAVWEHRAGMAADLAPAEAKTEKDKGTGWRLEAGKLGHKSLGASQFSLEFEDAQVLSGWKRRPEERSTCRAGPPILPGLRADGCLMAKVWLGSSHLSWDCRNYGVADGFSLCAPFRCGTLEAEYEEQRA